MRRWFLAVAFCAALMPIPLALGEGSFLVVVHASNLTPTLTQSQLSSIFLKKMSRWPGGERALPVDLLESSPIRETFSQVVHGKSTAAIKAYWQRMIFSGREAPPPEEPADREVLVYVSKNPGAIGYVASGTRLIDGVKLLTILDCVDCGEREIAERPWSGAQDAEIVGSRGEVYLLRTARCGPDDDGRLVVLQNRSLTDSNSVAIQRVLDVAGQRGSSHVERYSLWPGEEQELGCTALSQGSVEHFALVEVSDAALGSDKAPVAEAVRAARDLLTFTETGACGAGARGHGLVIYNTHDRQAVAATVEYVQKVDGRPQRQFRKTHLLGPGAEKELGCSADGALTLEVALVEAELR